MHGTRVPLALGAALALACGSGDDETSFGSASASATVTQTASASAGVTEATSGTSTGAPTTGQGVGETATSDPTSTGGDDDTAAFKFDLPAGGETSGGVTGDGCQKVDFLFVLDNSISMGDEQSNLAGSFPGFISTIQSQVAAQDYHIMVIDTDDQDKWGEKWNKCYQKCMTDDPGDSCLTVYFDDLICGELPPEPEACDQTLGAGRNKGAGGPPVVCPTEGGLRYMTQDQPQLADAFQCVAEMGATGNSNERPVDALRQALGPQSEAGGCHPGFLRDDAILVVTMISDEEEHGSAGDPQTWYADLLALKGGNPTAVVLLALSGDTETMGQECTPTPKMTELVGSFGERGFIGSVCEADYGPFFQEAVGVIDYACDQYIPT